MNNKDTENNKDTGNPDAETENPGSGARGSGARLSGEMLTAQLLALLKNWTGYGYELARRLEEAGFAGCNSGTLYRTLRQMEKAGLISSNWDTSNDGPARRMYSMTEAGDLFLDNWISLIDFHKKSLNIFLDASTMMLESAGRSMRQGRDGTQSGSADKPGTTNKQRDDKEKEDD